MRTVPVTRPTLRGSRIAHYCRNEQRESLTPICIYVTLHAIPIITTDITIVYENIPTETFTVALFLTIIKNLRDSEESKPKRQVNAFSIMSSPTLEPCRRERCDKGTTSRAENKIILIIFYPEANVSFFAALFQYKLMIKRSTK